MIVALVFIALCCRTIYTMRTKEAQEEKKFFDSTYYWSGFMLCILLNYFIALGVNFIVYVVGGIL